MYKNYEERRQEQKAQIAFKTMYEKLIQRIMHIPLKTNAQNNEKKMELIF